MIEKNVSKILIQPPHPLPSILAHDIKNFGYDSFCFTTCGRCGGSICYYSEYLFSSYFILTVDCDHEGDGIKDAISF